MSENWLVVWKNPFYRIAEAESYWKFLFSESGVGSGNLFLTRALGDSYLQEMLGNHYLKHYHQEFSIKAFIPNVES